MFFLKKYILPVVCKLQITILNWYDFMYSYNKTNQMH